MPRLPVKPRWILILVGVMAVGALISFWPSSNPPYTIEIRHVAKDGTVTYEPRQYGKWPHARDIAGLRFHTQDIIYHCVYFDGLQYCFSRSGHVYAMAFAENDETSIFDREWAWSGEPHQFPHYDYSKISPHVRQ